MAASQSLSRSAKLQERCTTLAAIVRQVAPVYRDPTATANQLHFIETMIGAAIWYLPNADNLWTSRISLKAVESFHPSSDVSRPKLTMDHEFPRKVAARELLGLAWEDYADPAVEMLQRYLTRYGRYNLITSNENRRLMRFQKTAAFDTASKAYQDAGIILLTTTAADLVKIKSRDSDMIESLIASMASTAEVGG